jgi:hypothetical protein
MMRLLCPRYTQKTQIMIKNKAQDMKRYLSPDLNYVLEFGALASPLFETHSKALYCDHLERDELLLKYSAHSEDFKKNIVNTDFVWSGGKDLEVFEGVVGKVEIMGASHLIEHVPDLIGWLQRLQVLAADNCVLSLAVPIKTNTFDYYRPTSTLGDFLDAYVNEAKRPSLRHVVDQRRYAVRYRGENAWHHQTEAKNLVPVFPDVSSWKSIYEDYLEGNYVDSHCWVFTCDSFVENLKDFQELGLIDWIIVNEPNAWGSEFVVHLNRG